MNLRGVIRNIIIDSDEFVRRRIAYDLCSASDKSTDFSSILMIVRFVVHLYKYRNEL